MQDVATVVIRSTVGRQEFDAVVYRIRKGDHLCVISLVRDRPERAVYRSQEIEDWRQAVLDFRRDRKVLREVRIACLHRYTRETNAKEA